MSEQLGPQVQLVYNEQEYVAPLAEVAPDLNPATAGDAEIIEAVAYHWDIPVENLSKHQVTRPSTGNVLVSEKAVFGGKAMTFEELHERTMQEDFSIGCRECGGRPLKVNEDIPMIIVGNYAFFNNGYLADWYAKKEGKPVEEKKVRLVLANG